MADQSVVSGVDAADHVHLRGRAALHVPGLGDLPVGLRAVEGAHHCPSRLRVLLPARLGDESKPGCCSKVQHMFGNVLVVAPPFVLWMLSYGWLRSRRLVFNDPVGDGLVSSLATSASPI